MNQKQPGKVFQPDLDDMVDAMPACYGLRKRFKSNRAHNYTKLDGYFYPLMEPEENVWISRLYKEDPSQFRKKLVSHLARGNIVGQEFQNDHSDPPFCHRAQTLWAEIQDYDDDGDMMERIRFAAKDVRVRLALPLIEGEVPLEKPFPETIGLFFLAENADVAIKYHDEPSSLKNGLVCFKDGAHKCLYLTSICFKQDANVAFTILARRLNPPNMPDELRVPEDKLMQILKPITPENV